MSDSALLQTIADRLAAIELHLGISGGGGGSSASGEELPRSIRAYDEYSAANLDPFVAACEKLGGECATLGHCVRDAWNEQRSFLLMASACKEPPQTAFGTLLTPIGEKTRAIGDLLQRNEWEKHVKTCQEGVQCLNWLVVKPAPRDFIEAYIGGSDYWANNIRREYKATNPDQIAFCDTFKNLIKELMVYVKEFHTTGTSWNSRGVDYTEYSAGAASAPPAAPAAAKTAPAAKTAAPAKSSTAPTANLFAELSKDGSVTSGLKTVTKDMQTWRQEYKGGDAPAPVARKAPAPRAAEAPKGDAKLEYMAAGAKWIVEYQGSAQGPVTVEIGDKKETVYIFGCVGAHITVKGKCKSIILDGCKKTHLYFDAAFASMEVVNSQRVQVHVMDFVPSVAIDKTDGISVHLSATSMSTEITASKSSEMNVNFPGPDGEIMERPIPEQYIHRINGTSVTADVTDLYHA